MLQRFLFITLTLCSLTASAQWQQTGSKVRYVNGLGIPTKDTAAGVSADSSQIVIRPADSSLYVKYKRTWLRVGGGAGGGSIGGSGTTNYVPKFTASGFIGNSQIFDNGTNVGIGTASPLDKLHVNGRVQASVATSGSSYFFASNTSGGTSYGNDGTGGYIFTTWNAPLLIYTNSLERMRITSGGNVLIGTTTDNGVDKLQVSGSINVSAKATVQNLSVTSNATIGATINANDIFIVGSGSIPTLTATQFITQSFSAQTTAKTTTYTTAFNDYFIDCTSGTFTVNLQAAASYQGRVLIIKNSGAGTITVDGNAAETIDGAATYSLSATNATVQIISNGTNWKIISKF